MTGNKRVRHLTERKVTGMMILISNYALVDVNVDNYELGELAHVNTWDFDVRGTYDSVEELIKAIHKETYVFGDKIDDYIFLDGYLHTDALVNVDNEEPSKAEYEAWKRGKETLYNAHLTLPLYCVMEEHKMTEDEAESFGLSIY